MMFVENLCEMIGEHLQAVEGFVISRILVKLPRRLPLGENIFRLDQKKFMVGELILNFVIGYVEKHFIRKTGGVCPVLHF